MRPTPNRHRRPDTSPRPHLPLQPQALPQPGERVSTWASKSVTCWFLSWLRHSPPATLNKARPLPGPYLLACEMPTTGAVVTKAWHGEGAQSFASFLVWPPASHTHPSLAGSGGAQGGGGLRTHTAICLRTEDAQQEGTGHTGFSQRPAGPHPEAARASPRCRP